MNKIPEQYIYNKHNWLIGRSPVIIEPTGKFPIIANHQWKTYDDLMLFVKDDTSTAIPGMIVSVIDDDDVTKNGVYVIDSIGVNGVVSKMVKESEVYDKIDTIQKNIVSWVDNDKGIRSIVLPNFGMIIGEPNYGEPTVGEKAPENGNASLVMLSQWNVADFGSIKYPINLNGSGERPTYNDSNPLALLSDIKIYDDSELRERIINLENKEDKDTIYDDTEIRENIKSIENVVSNKVDWQKNIHNVNSIVLPNYGQIVGEPNSEIILEGMTEANGNASLLMLSQWNVVDIGSIKYPINLNGLKNKRPTYNDTKEIALLEDLNGYVTTESLDKFKNDLLGVDLKDSLDTLETIKNWKETHGLDYETLLQTVNNLETNKADKESIENAFDTLIDDIDNKFQRKGDYLTFTINRDNDNQKVTTFDNNQIIGSIPNTTQEGRFEPKDNKTWLSLIHLNKWNVVDLGNPYVPTNINTPKDVRPTVQEAGQSGVDAHKIAYLSDVESLNDVYQIKGDYLTVINNNNQKITTLENHQVIGAIVNETQDGRVETTDGRKWVGLIELNKWNVVDIGNPYLPTNINTPKDVRPTVQEAGQSGADAHKIAYLDDINELKEEIKKLYKLVNVRATIIS